MRAIQYLYDIEGERKVGTLIDYANDREHAYYASLDVGPLLDLHGNEVPFEKHSYTTEDDWAITELTVDGHYVKMRFDLRA